MIKTIIAMVTKIPKPKPVLKIPSITEHPVTKKEVNRTNSVNVILFFMMYYFKFLLQISPKRLFFALYYFLY